MDILRRNTDYALRMVIRLVGGEAAGPVSVRRLAEEGDVPYPLACKLMQGLQQAGLVQSSMGPRGGFCLSRGADRISVLKIIEAVQGPISLNRCLLSDRVCRRGSACPIRARLRDLQRKIEEYLGAISLQELVAGHGRKGRMQKRRQK